MSVSAARTGITLPTFGRQLSTEFSVTGFQLAMGVFGGLGAIIAARRLESVERDVYISELMVPIIIGGVSTVLGATLLPTASSSGNVL